MATINPPVEEDQQSNVKQQESVPSPSTAATHISTQPNDNNINSTTQDNMTEQPFTNSSDTTPAAEDDEALSASALFDHLCNSLRGLLSRQNVASDPKLAQIMRSWAENYQQNLNNSGNTNATNAVSDQPSEPTSVKNSNSMENTTPSDRQQAPLGIPVSGLLEHPLLSGLKIDEELLYAAAETLPSNVVTVHRNQGYLEPIMKAERSTIFLRDMPEGTTTEESIRELLMTSPHLTEEDSMAVISAIRHEPIGNLWFVTLSSSKLATEVALWLRQQELDGRPVVVGMKSEAEYLSPLSKSSVNPSFNMEGMFVPMMYTPPPLVGNNVTTPGGGFFPGVRRGGHDNQCVTSASGWSGSPPHSAYGRNYYHGQRRLNGQFRTAGQPNGYRPNTPDGFTRTGGGGLNHHGVKNSPDNEGGRRFNNNNRSQQQGGNYYSDRTNYRGGRNSRGGRRLQGNRHGGHIPPNTDIHSYNNQGTATTPPPPAYLKDVLEFPPITLAAKLTVSNNSPVDRAPPNGSQSHRGTVEVSNDPPTDTAPGPAEGQEIDATSKHTDF